MSRTSSITYVRECGGGGVPCPLFDNHVLEVVAEMYNKTPETLDEQKKQDAFILYYIFFHNIDIEGY